MYTPNKLTPYTLNPAIKPHDYSLRKGKSAKPSPLKHHSTFFPFVFRPKLFDKKGA
jgi:hypothetical protein